MSVAMQKYVELGKTHSYISILYSSFRWGIESTELSMNSIFILTFYFLVNFNQKVAFALLIFIACCKRSKRINLFR